MGPFITIVPPEPIMFGEPILDIRNWVAHINRLKQYRISGVKERYEAELYDKAISEREASLYKTYPLLPDMLEKLISINQVLDVELSC